MKNDPHDLRSRVLARMAKAIECPPDADRREFTVATHETLAVLLATVHLARAGIPYSGEQVEELAVFLVDALGEWTRCRTASN